MDKGNELTPLKDGIGLYALDTNFWLFQLVGALDDLEFLYESIVQEDDANLTLDAQDQKVKLSEKFRENGWE